MRQVFKKVSVRQKIGVSTPRPPRLPCCFDFRPLASKNPDRGERDTSLRGPPGLSTRQNGLSKSIFYELQHETKITSGQPGRPCFFFLFFFFFRLFFFHDRLQAHERAGVAPSAKCC